MSRGSGWTPPLRPTLRDMYNSEEEDEFYSDADRNPDHWTNHVRCQICRVTLHRAKGPVKWLGPDDFVCGECRKKLK